MKKILNIFIFLAALTFASSCQDEAELNPPEQDRTVTITAAPDRTKTALEGNSVVWEKGDEVDLVFTHSSKSPSVVAFATGITSSTVTADFKGRISSDILDADSGYDDAVYAYYPSDRISDGKIDFTLPSEQTIRENGTFAAGLNLASAKVSLADIKDDGNASAVFRNALSILRFTLADNVTSVILEGTSSLAGKAPLELDGNGRLVVNSEGEWTSPSTSVTLLPAEGNDCFTGGEVNLLVWPGTHNEMTVTVNTSDFGPVSKTSTQVVTFEPAKFYTLNFNADSETLVQEIEQKLGGFDEDLTDLESRLDQLETNAEKISVLLDQIQSVALVSEYLNNAAYAPYAKQMYNKLTVGIKLRYLVRPAAAMELLLDVCAEEGNLSEVLTAVVYNKNGTIGTITVTEALLEDDILTVVVTPPATVGRDHWLDAFYEGTADLSLALQISDGNTEIISDFANLVPKKGAVLNITKTDNIPVLKGASFSMAFTYAAEDFNACEISISSTGFSSAPTVSASNGNGHIYANFGQNDDLSNKSITVTMTNGGETQSQTLTFADGGRFDIETSGDVDYVGGEVTFNVGQNDFGSYNINFTGTDWIYQTNTGSNNRLTVNYNSGAARSVSATVSVGSGSISYTKSLTITQKAYGSAIDESRYHQTKAATVLQNATAGYTPLNIVIIGDGYQKKDLQKGGKFERSADSAMEAFFGVEPYKSFRNRFRVVMVAYESQDEGLSLQNGTQKNTYFKSYYQGSGNTYVNLSGGDYSSVVNVVKNDLGWSDDATYYRTIVIMLINTSEGIGSNAAIYRASYGNTSTLGEPYASMALAMVTANNTETSNLIRHEAGGHAFGRLGDEYPSKTWDSSVNSMHDIGWYRNVTVNKSQWNWDGFIGRAGYEDVTYYQPNSSYWCPVDHTKYNSIMYNNTNKYNAPSRQIIYERIVRQTEGSNAYSWNKFLEYDKKNTQTGGAF